MRKLWLFLSFIVLAFSTFVYEYYSTIKNVVTETPKQKPDIRIENKTNLIPGYIVEEEVNNVPQEEKITPSTVIVKKILSINTGKSVVQSEEKADDNIVNFTKQQAQEYFKGYGRIVDFNKDKVTIVKETPYLPNVYVVKLDNKFIKVFKTNSNGVATLYDDFEPIPMKNKDSVLEKGIEVNTLEEVWKTVQDYE